MIKWGGVSMDVAIERLLAGYSSTREATEPWCLRPGEAAELLTGQPWRRFVVLGDSVAAGLGDPVDGYLSLPWIDRVAAELCLAGAAGLEYRNLGRRDLRAAQIRERQLPEALAFRPDLALVTCGANDALRPWYDPSAVDTELAGIISGLLDAGVEVITVGMLVLPAYPAIRPDRRAATVARLRQLAAHTGRLAAALGTIHVDLSDHPVAAEPDVYSSDGLHGNARTHAVAAAAVVRRIGEHLAARTVVRD